MTGWTHEFGCEVSAPPERVFSALTDAGELTRWFAEQVEVEPGSVAPSGSGGSTPMERRAGRKPVADAIVEAYSLDTRVTRTAKTDPRGRYRILFPDGGGQYRLTVRFIGLLPVQPTIARQTDEDRIVSDVKLSSSPQKLQDIVVRGRSNRNANFTPPTPGSTERPLNPRRGSGGHR